MYTKIESTMTKKVNITYNNASQPFVLDALGLELNKDGNIINSKSQKLVRDVNKHPIKAKEFGGVGKASRHFVKKDAFSLLKLRKIIDKRR